jgi:hypothetical protein
VTTTELLLFLILCVLAGLTGYVTGLGRGIARTAAATENTANNTKSIQFLTAGIYGVVRDAQDPSAGPGCTQTLCGDTLHVPAAYGGCTCTTPTD